MQRMQPVVAGQAQQLWSRTILQHYSSRFNFKHRVNRELSLHIIPYLVTDEAVRTAEKGKKPNF